ncbi:MAG: LysE family transporter [Thermodesulfobacteriota bacterium]|jgi:threonine/homoserine/homoserine lactone efflux protein
MLALWGIFVTSFIIGLSGALMPGPVLTVTISQSATRGWMVGPLVVLGHGILELSLVVAIVYGLGQVLTHGSVIGAIGISGGIVLLWMGGSMLRGARKVSLVFEGEKGTASLHPVWAGILSSLSNPYWIVWWATIGLSYIGFSMKYGMMGISSFYTGHILSDLVWYAFVSSLVHFGKRWANDRAYQTLIAICGVLLLGFGVYFGYSGVKSFWN